MTEPEQPQSSSDERPVGWGDDLEDDDRADEDRLNADRPPHHDRD
jgi:hypothetical protein